MQNKNYQPSWEEAIGLSWLVSDE